MNEYLTYEIWKMRKNIKTEYGTPIVSLVNVEKNTYQLLFMSCGCENACTFCNYGFDYNLTLEMVKPELEKIRLEDFDISELELEANGSFLSEREIPYDLFLEVLRFVAHRNIPVITMETHYSTITEKKIQDIRAILGETQEVNFELGFESASEDVRSIYNKDIDIKKYLEVTKLCEKYGIGLQINVLLGAPFLTREEQIQDCIETLKFIYENMPGTTTTHAVLFPINIKENTMLKHWQEIGKYEQISSWEFVELLHKIPVEYLGRLTIAWWGIRENAFTKGITQHPTTCSKCRERLMKFYLDFYCDWNPLYRKRIIEEIWSSRCECDKK
jgi:radical SAM enzyme (TIGR01210 family)